MTCFFHHCFIPVADTAVFSSLLLVSARNVSDFSRFSSIFPFFTEEKVEVSPHTAAKQAWFWTVMRYGELRDGMVGSKANSRIILHR